MWRYRKYRAADSHAAAVTLRAFRVDHGVPDLASIGGVESRIQIVLNDHTGPDADVADD